MNETPTTLQVDRRLYRSRTDRMVGGVARGVADYFGLDPALVRLLAVVLAVTGPGIPIYIIMWIVIPEAPPGYEPSHPGSAAVRDADSRRWVGIALVAFGGWMLAQRWVPWIDDIFWPAALVVVGAAILLYGTRR